MERNTAYYLKGQNLIIVKVSNIMRHGLELHEAKQLRDQIDRAITEAETSANKGSVKMSLIIECEECNHTGKLKDGAVCPACKGKGRIDVDDLFEGMYTWRWS